MHKSPKRDLGHVVMQLHQKGEWTYLDRFFDVVKAKLNIWKLPWAFYVMVQPTDTPENKTKELNSYCADYWMVAMNSS